MELMVTLFHLSMLTRRRRTIPIVLTVLQAHSTCWLKGMFADLCVGIVFGKWTYAEKMVAFRSRQIAAHEVAKIYAYLKGK